MHTRLLGALAIILLLLIGGGEALAYSGPPLNVSRVVDGHLGLKNRDHALAIDGDPKTAATIAYGGGSIQYTYADGLPRTVSGITWTGNLLYGLSVELIDGSGQVVHKSTTGSSAQFDEAVSVLSYRFTSTGGNYWYLNDVQPHLLSTPPPGTPPVLQAQASPTTVALAWSSPVNGGAAAGYRVYRDGTHIAEVPGTSYSDQAVTPGTSYAYTVTAYNEGGESAPAESVMVTVPLPPIPPAAPHGVEVGPVSSSGVSISWQVPSSGGAPTGYRVYRDGTHIAEVPGTSYSDQAVTPGTSYAYTVTAYNEGGESAPAESVMVTVPILPDLPHTPVGVTASAGARQVTISWQHPGGGGPVDEYRVYRDGALLGVTQTTTWTDSKLSPQTTYAYAVSSFNQAGESERTTVSARTTDPGVIDGVISTLADLGPQVAQTIGILMPFFLVGAALIIAQRVLNTGVSWWGRGH